MGGDAQSGCQEVEIRCERASIRQSHSLITSPTADIDRLHDRRIVLNLQPPGAVSAGGISLTIPSAGPQRIRPAFTSSRRTDSSIRISRFKWIVFLCRFHNRAATWRWSGGLKRFGGRAHRSPSCPRCVGNDVRNRRRRVQVEWRTTR